MIRALFCAATVLLVSSAAGAQTAAPASPAAATSPAPTPTVDLAAQRILQIFTVKHVSPDWFTEDFLAHVPTSKIEDIAAQLNFGIGPVKTVARPNVKLADDPPPPWVRYIVVFKEGSDDVLIHINDAGKIDGLVFRTPHSSF
jgi:hypothetical protein